VNSLGFPGPDIAEPKPADVFRILFLGDSVTQQGLPHTVEQFLNTTYPNSDKRFESVALGISGYSSHQGRVLAELYGARLEPDIVVVLFGWNDHWQAYGSTDSEKVVTTKNAADDGFTETVYRNMRILQGLKWIWVELRNSEVAPLSDVRVPQSDYRDNLAKVEEIFSDQDVPVLFVTSPTSHYQMGVPDYLVELGFVRDKKTAARMHRDYNQVVRDIAGTGDSFLLDLEEELNTVSRDTLEALFRRDGIHLKPAGLAVIAGRIRDSIAGVSQ
jgi:lysophospholipase L1-like esterase